MAKDSRVQEIMSPRNPEIYIFNSVLRLSRFSENLALSMVNKQDTIEHLAQGKSHHSNLFILAFA